MSKFVRYASDADMNYLSKCWSTSYWSYYYTVANQSWSQLRSRQ